MFSVQGILFTAKLANEAFPQPHKPTFTPSPVLLRPESEQNMHTGSAWLATLCSLFPNQDGPHVYKKQRQGMNSPPTGSQIYKEPEIK